jgi:hypothetical protein
VKIVWRTIAFDPPCLQGTGSTDPFKRADATRVPPHREVGVVSWTSVEDIPDAQRFSNRCDQINDPEQATPPGVRLR